MICTTLFRQVRLLTQSEPSTKRLTLLEFVVLLLLVSQSGWGDLMVVPMYR